MPDNNNEDKQSFRLRLSEKARKRLTETVVEDFRRDNLDRLDAFQRRKKFRADYEQIRTLKKWPWEGASNFRTTKYAEAVDNLHPRIMTAFFGQEPFVLVRAQEPFDQEKAEKTEQFLNYGIRHDMPTLEGDLGMAIHNMLIDGDGFAKIVWDKRFLGSTKEMEETVTPEIEVVEGIESIKGHKTRKKLVTKKLFAEGPRLIPRDWEDIIVPSDAIDLETADHVIDRCFLSIAQLRWREKDNIYRNVTDNLNAIRASISASRGTMEIDDMAALKDEIEGVETQHRQGRPRTVEVIEWYGAFEIEEDGLPEEIIATVIPAVREGLIIRAVRLTDVFWHGKRPFLQFRFIPRPNRFYSIGVVEYLQNVAGEIETVHNQRIDREDVATTPFGFARAGSGIKVEDVKMLPGQINLVPEPSDIVFPTLPQNYAIGFKEEEMLNLYAERLVATGDLQSGRVPTPVGPTRTALATIRILEEGNVKVNWLIRQLRIPMTDLMTRIWQLYQQFMPKTKQIRILGPLRPGEEPFMEISREEIRLHADLQFTGTVASTNKFLDRENTDARFQALAASPLTPLLLQMGILTPQGLYLLTKEFYEAHAGILADRVLQAPEGEGDRLLSPEEEHARLINGEIIQPNINDDQVGHLRAHNEFVASDAFKTFPPHVQRAFFDHIAATGILIRQLSQVQSQAGPEAIAPQEGTPEIEELRALFNLEPEQAAGGGI